MKKWRKPLAWLMIASMLAGSSMTSYADVSDSAVFHAEEMSESERAAGASSSEAKRPSEEETVATDSEIDKNEIFSVSYHVDPEGSAEVKGKDEVKYGKNLRFSVSPEKGYEIEAVRANGEELEGSCSLTGSGKTQNYVISNVKEDQDIEIDMLDLNEVRPEFSFEKEVNGVTVTITAEEGVLPKGTTAKVKAVSASKARKLAKEADYEGELQDVIAYDIKLYDAEGDELDDSWAENGAVKVSFSGEKLEEKQELADRVEIQHYNADDSNPEVKEIAADEELAIEAEHFSVFAIGFYAVRESSPSEIYVSADGNDETGKGTELEPYATLAKAADVINSNKEGGEDYTIYLLSDIEMKASARFNYGNNVLIEGKGNSITRIEEDEKSKKGFETTSDVSRSFYNPAMFEINDWNNSDEYESSLTFRNVTIDEQGRHAGSTFTTQSHDGGVDNRIFVQDAIVASYAENCKIILGKGALLKNFGGLSAVNVESGAEVIMEDGSEIIDDTYERKEGYGAIHAESGGIVTIENGAKIGGSETHYMKGRGLFLENGSKATVNGTIEYIKNASGTQKSTNGLAIYIYNSSEAVLGSTGRISNIEGVVGTNNAAVTILNSHFTSEDGSIISNVKNTAAVYSAASDSQKEQALINGVIENCNSDYQLRATYSIITIGETGLVQNNKAKYNIGTLYSTNGCQYVIKGKVINNSGGSAIYLTSHSGGHTDAYLEEGALVDGNGTGIRIDKTAKLTMNGGTISNNSTAVSIPTASDKGGQHFVMNGGSIINNTSSGLSFRMTNGQDAHVEINKGLIANNGSSSELSISGGTASDNNQRLLLEEGVLSGSRKISTSIGTLTLDDNYSTISLGSPGTVAIETITKLLHAIDGHEEWSTAGTTGLWFKPTTENFHFKVNRGSSVDPGLGTFFAYIPLTENGVPADDAELKWIDVTNEETLDVSMTGLVPNTSYAGIFIQNVTRRLKAADIEIYAGGGSGSAEYTTGLPEYTLQGLPSSLYNIKLEINGQEITLPSSTDEKKEYIQSLFSVSYYDAKGNQITDDTKPGVYTSRLSFHAPKLRSAAVPVENVRINDDEIEVAEGTLIIRNTNAKASVQTADGAFMGEVKISRDGALPEISDNAVAKITYSTGTFLINGDSKRRDQSDGIRLMNDALYDGEKTVAMERAFETLGKPETIGADYVYDMRYLDLVDAYNGNVWVTNGTYGGMDIYLPYPDDIREADKTSTDFRLLYLDVDREYGINGNPTMEDALRSAEVKELDYEVTDNGIKTTIARNEVVGGIYILAHATEVNYLNFEDLAFYMEAGQSEEERIKNFPLLRWSVTNSDGTESEIDLTDPNAAVFTYGSDNQIWDQQEGKDFPFDITFWNDDDEQLTLSTSYENMIGTFHAHLAPKDGVTNLKLNGALLQKGSLGSLTIAPLVDNNTSETFVPVETKVPAAPVTEKPVAIIPEGTKILVNGEYDLKDETNAQISLLVDHIQKEENEFGKAIKQRLMDEGKVLSTDPEKTGFTIRYLDLVDEKDGNVWVKLANNGKMSIYLPYPDGDMTRNYKMFRFSDMHRAYGFDGTEIQNAIDTSKIDTIDLEKTPYGLKMSVDNLGPFVLTWELEPEGKAPSITTETLPGAYVGSSYNEKIAADGDGTLSFEITGGALPNGLKLSADGTISGTPTRSGSYTFTVKVSNAFGETSKEFTINVKKRSGGGSGPSGGGGSGSGGGSVIGATYTAGIDGNWVHMDPDDFNTPITKEVPAGATPVNSPKWHAWKFYLTTGGTLHSGWSYIRNPYAVGDQPREGWFAFDADGIMQYGWYLDTATGKWYYLHRESDGMLGTMLTGWHYDEQDGKSYYLKPGSGEMLLGWQQIGDKWYYFNPTAPAVTWNYSEETGGWTFNGSASRPYGSMYRNEMTPDGYQVGDDGAWIK